MLLSHTGKIFAKLMEQYVCKTHFWPAIEQFDLRRGSSCTDALFSTIELSERTIEYDKEINILFADQKKAFGRVEKLS